MCLPGPPCVIDRSLSSDLTASDPSVCFHNLATTLLISSHETMTSYNVSVRLCGPTMSFAPAWRDVALAVPQDGPIAVLLCIIRDLSHVFLDLLLPSRFFLPPTS